MRLGAGIRNALLLLAVVVAAHVAVVGQSKAVSEAAAPAAPVREGMERTGKEWRGGACRARNSRSTYLSDLKARSDSVYAAQTDRARERWPPAPSELHRASGGGVVGNPAPRVQVPYTRESEERAALHRLVFGDTVEAGRGVVGARKEMESAFVPPSGYMSVSNAPDNSESA